MKKTAFSCIVFIFVLLVGCREDRQFAALLDGVDSLMNVRPDSALALLQAKADTIGYLSESQQMRYHLLTAKAQNKAYVDFTTDSLMLLVTDYYDHHGTPNDRVMAHYLLGCCYRDMGEAPATIECYKDAVNQADTTQSDCDFRTLMSIYGQMATLYDQQVMPTEELEALERSGWYALRCEDTLSYIKCIELKVRILRFYEDTTMILKTVDKSRNLFLKYGYVEDAARTLPAAIRIQLNRGDYNNAHKLMHIFETQSGLFDTQGNIQSRYAHYYNSKGRYYLGTNRLDSAEIFFKRLLQYGFKRDAYLGLIEVNRANGRHDSALTYAYQLKDAYNEEFSQLNTASVRQAESMYDYTRSQRIAHEKELDASRSQNIMLCISFVCFSLLAVAYLFYVVQRKQKEQQVKAAMQEVIDLTTLYQKSKEDARLAKHNLADFEAYKQKEVEELKAQLEQARQSFSGIDKKIKLKILSDSKIVAAFRNMTIPRPGKQKLPSEKQWSELSNAIMSALPLFYERISAKGLLSSQESRITMLTRLGFSVGELAVLLDTTSQRVTNAKRSANNKLFGEDSAQTFAENINKIQTQDV